MYFLVSLGTTNSVTPGQPDSCLLAATVKAKHVKMELQEKENVPIFTDVDKEIFLRDIYPEVTSICRFKHI